MTYYERAIALGTRDADYLGNYAALLDEVRNDPDRAEAGYEQAIEADPTHANNLTNYACFLANVRHDDDRAQAFFERAIEADPTQVNHLGAYAGFLDHNRHDSDRAEECYLRAIEADPANSWCLDRYASFLRFERNDAAGAEGYYKRAVAAERRHAGHFGNYGGLLFSLGRTDEGLRLVAQARDLGAESDPEVAVELAFYEYAHDPDPTRRQAGLVELKRMLREGARSPGWDLSDNVEQARRSGHSEPELLAMLARVIAETADISELAAFPAWSGDRQPEATR